MWTQGSTLLARGRNLGSGINLQCYAMHHPQACMQGIQPVERRSNAAEGAERSADAGTAAGCWRATFGTHGSGCGRCALTYWRRPACRTQGPVSRTSCGLTPSSGTEYPFPEATDNPAMLLRRCYAVWHSSGRSAVCHVINCNLFTQPHPPTEMQVHVHACDGQHAACRSRAQTFPGDAAVGTLPMPQEGIVPGLVSRLIPSQA